MRHEIKDKASMEYKPKDFKHLLGAPGFSDKMLKDHFKLYEGYVSNVNRLLDYFQSVIFEEQYKDAKFAESQRRFGWEFNGMRLHELYFGNIESESSLPDDESEIYSKICQDFESFENWSKEFVGIGSMRGIGWTILAYDPASDRLFNHWVNEHDTGLLAGSRILLVMDVFEHAFMTDYGLERGKYISAFMKAIAWSEVQNRFDDLDQ